MNAYIGPTTALYLERLEGRLREHGVNAAVRIMQSNGGISTVENSSRRPIGLLLSGPAGGVIGGRWTGASCNTNNVITIDVGGTSADISVIQNGELRIKNPRDTEVASLPVLVPMIDVDAIGAGGGSIAFLDPGGAFRVGPRSAGASPGPACYGKGGTEPAVTDAQVVLGRLDPEQFLGGDLRIDPSLAHKAVEDERRHAPQAFREGRRARHPARRQQQYGARDQRQFRRQGHRPAQLHADGFRRRGSAARDLARGDHRREGYDLAAASGHHRRDGPAHDRAAIRIHPLRPRRGAEGRQGGVRAGQPHPRRPHRRGPRAAPRRRRARGDASLHRGRRMPLRRPGLRAARADAGGASRAGQCQGGDQELLRRPQAGLWPRVRGSAGRDHHPARRRLVRHRHPEAAGTGEGRPRRSRRRPSSMSARPCSTTARRTRRRASIAPSCSPTTRSPARL